MDKLKSLQLENEIKGKEINGFKIIELINNGKSAAVFRASKDGNFYALKIFDNDLIERFGHEIQTKRIEQEIALKNHTIKNLVKIFDGGNTTVDNQDYYFIIMELIDGINLKDYILKNDYSQGFILKVLDKLYETTEQLLVEKNTAHRDIKPENIMVDNKGDIILMDLGVLKLVGAKSFSDEEEKSFVGTLRYAAPEFLLRDEEDTSAGWRAVNIYQIGATLHDLIMKNELFFDKIPYSNLVIAIKDDNPIISNKDLSFDLLQIVRDMLIKDWKKRLQLVNSNRIQNIIKQKEFEEDSFDAKIEEVLKMRMGHQAKFEEIEKLKRTKAELIEKQKNIGTSLVKVVDESLNKIKDKGIFNSFKKSPLFRFNNDISESLVQNYLYEIIGELKIGFPTKLYILVRIINDDNGYTEIDVWGIFPSPFTKADIHKPLDLFHELYGEKGLRYQVNRTGKPPVNNTFNRANIFKGVVTLDDGFSNHVSTQLVKLISVALLKVSDYVNKQLEIQQEMASSKKQIVSRSSVGLKNVIIDTLVGS